MVVDCAYGLDQLYVIEGGPPPGGEDLSEDAVLKATTWLIDKCEEDDGTLKVNFLNLNIVDFSSLATSCPELAPLRKNLNGMRTLLEVVLKKFRDPANTASCNAQLLAKFTDAVNCKAVLSYPYHAGHVGRELAHPYAHFLQCVAKNAPPCKMAGIPHTQLPKSGDNL